MFSRRTNWNLTANRFASVHQDLLREGRKILDLTISNPTRAGFDYDQPAILDALRNSNSLDYDPQPKGLRSAREAVAGYYSSEPDIPFPDPFKVGNPLRCSKGAGPNLKQVESESIILSTSTSEGYSYVFRLLCNPDDEVLVPKPSYPLFDFLADLQDVKLVPYPLIYDHGWQIDLHVLEQAITSKTRAIVLVHPNNPTGSYVKADERARLNRLCREHELALIVDEVFLDYAVAPAPSSFAMNREALTFTLSGVSKISALPQMKLAWIVVSGPENIAAEAMHRLEVIADTYLSQNAPVQLAAETLLDQRKKIQPQLRSRIEGNVAELDHQLAGQKSCARLEVEGGWYAVLRVPVTRSDEDLAIELLTKQSVLVHPGHFYDFPQDGYLVLSLITPPMTFREGISRILPNI
jgi:alanine-synthesizing transaminase